MVVPFAGYLYVCLFNYMYLQTCKGMYICMNFGIFDNNSLLWLLNTQSCVLKITFPKNCQDNLWLSLSLSLSCALKVTRLLQADVVKILYSCSLEHSITLELIIYICVLIDDTVNILIFIVDIVCHKYVLKQL